MDLFSLVAKLTLDTKEYEQEIADAESMGESIADPEAPSLGLDTDEYKGALDEAEEDTESWSGVVGDIFNELKSVIVAAGITAAISGVVSSLSEAVDLAAKLGDDVDKGSRRLNISAEAYQEWSHALEQSGASITDFNRGILSMNKYMSGVKVTDEVSGAFAQLGMDAKIANGQITTTEQLLTETVKALADFPGSKEERGALATILFGRGGSTLNALFDSGSEGIEALIKEAHELGLVMTDEEIANNVAYGDALANVQSAVTALKTSIVTELMPPLTDLMNTAAKIIAFFNWRSGDTPLSKQFEDIDNGSMDALASINMTESVAGNLADKLIAMGDASKLTADQQAIWKGTAEELVGLIPSLSSVINTDTMEINGNKKAIDENIKAWANLARQRALNDAIEQKQRLMQEEHTEAINAQIDALVAESGAEAERTKAATAANELLSKNTKLQEAYGKSIDDSADTLGQLEDLLAIAETAPDVSGFAELYNIINDLTAAETKREEAQRKSESYADELAKAKEEYDAWLEAASQIFGTAEESADGAEESVNALNTALDHLPDEKHIKIFIDSDGNFGLIPMFKQAKGNWDVPYDNYPSLLHRDEMVLTASDARKYREGNSGGNADIVSALLSMRNDLQNFQLVVGTKTFGRAVVDYGGRRVDNYLGSADSKLYSGYGT